MNKRQDRKDRHLEEKQKAFQKEYQIKYRAENKKKAVIEQAKWIKKNVTYKGINRGLEWSDRDISVVMTRKDNRWKYTIKTMTKMLGRTHYGITQVRAKVKSGGLSYRHVSGL